MSKIRLSSDGATQAQINANRQNAQKSTGPKTPEGKAAVAQNAVKHGLFVRKDVVISENQAEFDALRDDILAELAPAGTMETILAERIVSLTWRLKRAERMHNEVIEAKIRREIYSMAPKLSKSLVTGEPSDVSKYSKDCYDDLVLGYVAMWDFTDARALERLSMYERRFEASLFKMMAEFKKLQGARKRDQPEPAETKEVSYRGRDARGTECAKQSQSVKNDVPDRSSADQAELSAFEKKEHELLLGAAPTPNKANPSGLSRFPGGLPDRPSLGPKEMSSFIKETYGNNPPMWAQATLRHLKEQAKSFQGSRVHGNGKKKRALELSLLRL